MANRRDFIKLGGVTTATLLAGSSAMGQPQEGKTPCSKVHGSLNDQITVRRRGTGLILCDRKRSIGGYTLYTPISGNGEVYLVDIHGEIVHQWKLPVRPGRHAVLLNSGNLGYNGSHATSAGLYPFWDVWHGGDFYEVNPDGEVVWRHGDIYHHHDAQWLPNGNLLYTVAAQPPRNFSAKIVGGYPERSNDEEIICDIVREVNRAGKVIWEWRSWEYIDPKQFPIHTVFNREHWPLINGISVTRDGRVLMSLRTTSGIIAVDRQTGKIIWHVGPDTVTQQHAPVETQNGNILVFDNGNLRKGSAVPYSRALEFEPIKGTTVWEYTDPIRESFFSPYMGSAQRLANGNTFICESAFGRLFEVTSDGDVVWEYVIPYFAKHPVPFVHGYNNSVFRAYRYTREQIPWL